jgi:RimJ/RimL family protein N-acetyltransferase
MVEVGYLTDPLERRKGHARAALRIMIDVARKEPAVKVVRATVPILWPENWVSRKLAEGEGFVQVGEEWDEEDGLKNVFELCV